MTTGYLWTGQFEECKDVIENGRPQSMELDEETLNGHWATNNQTNMDFFIINDATFSKLCILGNDVEPCFEGASVTEASTNFTKIDDNFKKTLFSMMQDLKFALEGGQKMEEEKTSIEEEVLVEEKIENEQDDKIEQSTIEENNNSIEENIEETSEETFSKKEDNDNDKDEDEDKQDDNKEEDKDEKYSLLENKYNELVSDYTSLKEENEKLLSFKNAIEDKQKDELIKSFYMLSDEDKKEVIENKAKYSLEDIEAKLSIICVRKKVNFNLEEETEKEKNVTYSLNQNSEESVPAFIAAMRKNKEQE